MANSSSMISQSKGMHNYPILLSQRIHISMLGLVLEKMSNLRDISKFVNLLPVKKETKDAMFTALSKLFRTASSTDAEGVISDLRQVRIIPDIENRSDTAPDVRVEDAQRKLDLILDEFWLIIDEENASRMQELSGMIREIFIGIFATLQKQGKDIDTLKKETETLKTQVEKMQGSQDDLLLGSVSTQIIIKLSRFGCQTHDHPGIDACRSMDMIAAQPNIQQIKSFLTGHGYSFEEVRFAVHILKSSRVEAAHPSNPSTSSSDIQCAIDHLYPVHHPKRNYAQKALKVLEALAQHSNETLFLQTNYR